MDYIQAWEELKEYLSMKVHAYTEAVMDNEEKLKTRELCLGKAYSLQKVLGVMEYYENTSEPLPEFIPYEPSSEITEDDPLSSVFNDYFDTGETPTDKY